MKLQCAGRISSAEATEAAIREAFADDDGRGEFIILAEADQVYLQAAGEGYGPYTVEYRDGSADRHFQSVCEVGKAEVEAVFLKYLARDTTWRTDLQWKPLEEEPGQTKPWWKFW